MPRRRLARDAGGVRGACAQENPTGPARQSGGDSRRSRVAAALPGAADDRGLLRTRAICDLEFRGRLRFPPLAWGIVPSRMLPVPRTERVQRIAGSVVTTAVTAGLAVLI